MRITSRASLYRLGSYITRHLEIETPEWIKERLKRRISRDSLLDMLGGLEAVLREYELMVKEFCHEIKIRAREEGVAVNFLFVSCRKRKGFCGTCFGNAKAHGPVWQMRTSQGRWVTIRKVQEQDFLRTWLSEEELSQYYQLVQMRLDYLILHNYMLLRLQKDGLIGEEDIEWR